LQRHVLVAAALLFGSSCEGGGDDPATDPVDSTDDDGSTADSTTATPEPGSSEASGITEASTEGSAGGTESGAPIGPCQAIVEEQRPSTANHVDLCSPLEYDTNPPSGGEHYGSWPAFQTYAFPVPAGFLVHALEHGAVVFWYNCPDGCDDEVQAAEAFIAGLAEDPLCAGLGTSRRAILSPYPDLDSRWAASAWGWTLEADCLDPQEFGAFYAAHYGNGLEALCSPGIAFDEDPCL